MDDMGMMGMGEEPMGQEEIGGMDGMGGQLQQLIAMAMVAREEDGRNGPPKQDYADANPYGEGAHGSWLEENIDVLDGMSGGPFEGNLDMEIQDDEDDAIETRDAMIEDDVELADRSAGYQKRSMGLKGEEGY